MKKEKILKSLILLPKKNIIHNPKKGFTIIELLVTITIIILISSTSVFYFLDYVKQQEINQKTQTILDEISQLDKDIKNYKILDYELHFSSQENQNKSYITNINNFDGINQNLEINDSTGSGVIKSIGTGTGILKIYENDKLIISNITDKNIDYNYNFNNSKEYEISGSFSGEILNDIIFNYFSEENIPPKNKNIIKIVEINTKQDKSGTKIDNLKIVNIGGNKTFYNDSTQLTQNKVYLFFENNGKEKNIEIKK